MGTNWSTETYEIKNYNTNNNRYTLILYGIDGEFSREELQQIDVNVEEEVLAPAPVESSRTTRERRPNPKYLQNLSHEMSIFFEMSIAVTI